MLISQIGFALLLAATLGGCGHSQAKIGDPPPPEVNVSTPVTREITDHVEFTGHTEATKTVVVRARVSGYLEHVLFKEGAEVHEGDALFEIDPQPYKAEKERAVANLELARAHLKRMEANYKRAKSLIGTNAISQQDYDQAVGDYGEALATVNVADAALKSADLNLKWTRVLAPISGRISRQMIDPGNMVKADDTPLTTIVSPDPIYAYFDVDERTVLEFRRLIKEGKVRSARQNQIKILLGLAGEEGFPHEGIINFIDNMVDMPTGTLRFRGVFPNTDRIIPPGLYARIQVPKGDPHEALLISEQALGSDQGKKFLYILNDKNEVTRRDIEVGSLNDSLRVVLSGLKPGERVVVSGLQRVRPGIKVNPKDVAMTDKGVPVAAAPAPVSPGAATPVSVKSGGAPPTPSAPVKTANPKPDDKPRPGVKSTAVTRSSWEF